MEVFETFRPQSEVVGKYVDYYYLDIKPDNISHDFQCFPHFNNTLSLYKSHRRLETGEMVFDKGAVPFQIFTPVRDSILHVKQAGPVHRVVVVFHALGIQQFFRGGGFAGYITGREFFTSSELQEIFSTNDISTLTGRMDKFLEARFQKAENPVLEKALQYIFHSDESFSVKEISRRVGLSRQHLNRIFQSNLGVSVKKFHEIVLFRQTLNRKLFENPEGNFTELAHEFNFNDQSHFIKTYKRLTDSSPGVFFRKGTVLGKEDTFWHLQP